MQLMAQATINWDPLINGLNAWIAWGSIDFMHAMISIFGLAILIGMVVSAVKGLF
jgi:hypothetical protein